LKHFPGVLRKTSPVFFKEELTLVLRKNSPGPEAEFIWATSSLLSKIKNVLDSSYRTHLVQKQNSFGPQELSCPKIKMSWTTATELTWSRSRPHLVNRYSPVQNNEYPEAKFLYEIPTKVLRVFLLAIHSHLYSFYFFKLTQPLTVSRVKFLYTVK
jgi:hypothetical protein